MHIKENKEFGERMRLLLASFAQELPDRINEIEALWSKLQAEWDIKALQELHRSVHNLVSNGKTFGYPQLSIEARALEQVLKSLMHREVAIDTLQSARILQQILELKRTFANAQLAWRYWQGETVAIGAFTSRGKARFDGCPDASGRFGTDRNTQSLSGARVSSSLFYAPWWSSRLTVGHGRDELRIDGFEPARFETRQDQAAWIHEFGTRVGTMLLGFETVRQRVLSDTVFTRTKRDTDSVFAGINESWHGQRLEASVRRDEDGQFGGRTTGSASWGFPWPGLGIVALTMGRGYRAPTFFDLYAPSSDFYVPNADLRPDRSESREITVKPAAGSAPWPPPTRAWTPSSPSGCRTSATRSKASGSTARRRSSERPIASFHRTYCDISFAS